MTCCSLEDNKSKLRWCMSVTLSGVVELGAIEAALRTLNLDPKLR